MRYQDFLDAIRKPAELSLHLKHLPVIVLTAKGDEDNEVRVLELGADDFLTKPFRARALAARLESLLGRRRAV